MLSFGATGFGRLQTKGPANHQAGWDQVPRDSPLLGSFGCLRKKQKDPGFSSQVLYVV